MAEERKVYQFTYWEVLNSEWTALAFQAQQEEGWEVINIETLPGPELAFRIFARKWQVTKRVK
jgi:hypothetical protein